MKPDMTPEEIEKMVAEWAEEEFPPYTYILSFDWDGKKEMRVMLIDKDDRTPVSGTYSLLERPALDVAHAISALTYDDLKERPANG
jgi:hypothetical protein